MGFTETLIVGVVLVYFFGLSIGIYTERRNIRPLTGGHYRPYWYECSECMPGAVFRFGADTKKHLQQIVDWHNEDYHNGDFEDTE